MERYAMIKMKMMTKISKVTFLMLIIYSPFCYSQSDDFGIWTGISVKQELVNNLNAEASANLRTFNDSREIEQVFVEGTLQYRFSDYLAVAGSYRLISRNESENEFFYRHKLFADFKLTYPSGRLEFSGRLRFQRTTKTYIEDDEDLIAKNYVRLKMQAYWNTPSFPLNPFMNYELFTPVSSDKGFTICKSRFSSGFDMKVTKNFTIETGYIFQKDLLSSINNEHIASLNFKFKF